MKKLILLSSILLLNYKLIASNISGLINQDTVLTLSNSPWIVTADLLVNQNVILTIEAGVTLKINNGINMYVDGTLIMLGTSSDSIFINTTNSIGSAGNMSVSNFATPNSIIKYCSFSNINFNSTVKTFFTNSRLVNSPIKFDQTTSTSSFNQILDSLVINGGTYGIRFGRYVGGEIKNCSITNAQIGIFTYGAYSYMTLSIINNNISDNLGTAIHNSHCGDWNLLVKDNIISHNNGHAIYCESDPGFVCSILQNNISNNTDGIHLIEHGNVGSGVSPQSLIVKNNLFFQNNNGIYFDLKYNTGVIDSVKYNDFVGNMNYSINMKATRIQGLTTFNATDNYWGTNLTSDIEASIYDFYDDFNNVEVIYSPFILTTNIHENEINSINPTLVYPNPTSDIINVEGNIKNSCICIYDAFGRLLARDIVLTSTYQKDLGDLESGIYFLIVDHNDKKDFKKIVKN